MIEGRITFTDSNVVLEFTSAFAANAAFESLRRATNAPRMTLWVRAGNRCDLIQFTPNGG